MEWIDLEEVADRLRQELRVEPLAQRMEILLHLLEQAEMRTRYKRRAVTGEIKMSDERELVAAENYVRDGEEKIAKLEARITELESTGGDSNRARELLRT